MAIAEHRALVVSFHAPPGNAIGGLRWWGLSRHLARRGWRIHLLTAQRGADRVDVPDGMTVEVVTTDTTLNDQYRSWKGSRNGSSAGSAPAVRGSSDRVTSGNPLMARLRGFRRDVGGILSFPGEGRGWINPARRVLRERLSDFDPTIVVTSGPPYSVHLAGGMAMRRAMTPWVADFRDPWSDTAREHLDAGWSPLIFARLEASVIRSASEVITTTPELADILSERYPGSAVDFLPNGVDAETLPERAPKSDNALRVAHIGTLYHGRDPVPAVRAFARFLQRHPAAREGGSTLSFVGNMEDHYHSLITRAVEEEGIEGSVHMPGPVPRTEAIRILSETGVSLVLAQNQRTAVPAKIYEAAGMRMPTLVVTEPDSATALAGRRLGAAVHSSDDFDGMAHTLAQAWLGRWTGDLPEGVLVDYADLSGEVEALLLRTIARSGG